jgi:NADPH:quinone reductase-like Zn-dependent oxidoreductase
VRAVLVREPGGPEQLTLGEYPTPEPGPGELLVKVKAAGVNRADILQRRGRYPPPPGASPILGLDVAGVVERAISEWQPGDRVCGLLPGGGYAEHVTMPAGLAIPIPPSLSFDEAAAIPEVFLTAFQCLVWIGGLRDLREPAGSPADVNARSGSPSGEGATGFVGAAGGIRAGGPLARERWSGTPDWVPRHVLIHAGASGVGTAAIQLVRDAGAQPLVTAGTDAKLEACRALGAVAAFNYKEGSFTPAVRAATAGRGVDLVLDVVGAPYWEQNLECLALDGRIVLIATMGGGRVEGFDLAALMRKRAWVTGTTLRVRDLGYKIRLTRELATHAMPRFADGRLRAVVDRVFDWKDAAEAHRYMEENRNVGKIVLTGM